MSELLSLEHVHKAYWRGVHKTVVVADLSLQVHTGELVMIWGQRGSGKTTLARLAAGLDRPDMGSIRFAGDDLTAIRRGATPLLHERIGWVRRAGSEGSGFQTVVEHVAVPLLSRYSPRAARRQAASMLLRFGVGDCADARWESLTDGQRTLVAIVRALVREPSLLVADDPTAYLSVLQREEVMRLLRTACDDRGVGALVTVPDMPEMAYANRVGSLSNGGLAMPPIPENVIDFPSRERAG
jgi:putative ABC transport system ATP-binding protein